MPVDVAVEHPLDEGPLELGAGTGERVEARPRYPLAALEVEDAQGLADLPVRPWLEVESGQVGVLAQHDVAGLVLAVGHVGRGDVGEAGERMWSISSRSAPLFASSSLMRSPTPSISAISSGGLGFMRDSFLLVSLRSARSVSPSVIRARRSASASRSRSMGASS